MSTQTSSRDPLFHPGLLWRENHQWTQCNHRGQSLGRVSLRHKGRKLLELRGQHHRRIFELVGRSSDPSRSCREVLQAPLKNAGYFFYKTWKIQGPCMETFCRITMQLSLFELKLKTFPLLHHRDHFVFTRKFLMQLPSVNTTSQI